MTPTAIELWNDKKFIQKRISEQEKYMDNLILNKYRYSDERYMELFNSGLSQGLRFFKRAKELNIFCRKVRAWEFN